MVTSRLPPHLESWRASALGCATTPEEAVADGACHAPWSLPPGDPGFDDEIARCVGQSLRERTIMELGRRWPYGRRDPERFVPGDVAALRSIALDSVLAQTVQHRTSQRPGSQAVAASFLGLARAVSAAEPHFVPSSFAAAVCDAPTPPEVLDDARLGWPATLVTFDRDVAFDPAALDEPWVWALPPGSLVTQIAERGGAVSGVVLLAEPDGVLRDDFAWLLAANPDPAGLAPEDTIRGVVWAWRSKAHLRDVPDGLAALVAWAGFSEPAEMVLPAEPRSLRKVAKTSRFRHAERAGAAVGVRVSDWRPPQRAPARPGRDPDAPHRRSPVPHMRKGHWRRVPVGPRPEGRRERRWVPVTVVAGGSDPDTLRIWKITDRSSSRPQPSPFTPPDAL